MRVQCRPVVCSVLQQVMAQRVEAGMGVVRRPTESATKRVGERSKATIPFDDQVRAIECAPLRARRRRNRCGDRSRCEVAHCNRVAAHHKDAASIAPCPKLSLWLRQRVRHEVECDISLTRDPDQQFSPSPLDPRGNGVIGMTVGGNPIHGSACPEAFFRLVALLPCSTMRRASRRADPPRAIPENPLPAAWR
jgi:hypothetical protein